MLRNASTSRTKRTGLRQIGCARICGNAEVQLAMVVSLRVRDRENLRQQESCGWPLSFVRLQARRSQRAIRCCQTHARLVQQVTDLRHLGQHSAALPQPEQSILLPLRWPRHRSVRGMEGKLRGIPSGHGPDMAEGSDDRTHLRGPWVRARQLHLDANVGTVENAAHARPQEEAE